MLKVPPWERPSAAQAPPQGAPHGSLQLGAPRERPAYWAPSHSLGCSSEPPPKPPVSPPFHQASNLTLALALALPVTLNPNPDPFTSQVSLTPSQFCRAAKHHQRGRRLQILGPLVRSKPAVYELDLEFPVPSVKEKTSPTATAVPQPIKVPPPARPHPPAPSRPRLRDASPSPFFPYYPSTARNHAPLLSCSRSVWVGAGWSLSRNTCRRD